MSGGQQEPADAIPWTGCPCAYPGGGLGLHVALGGGLGLDGGVRGGMVVLEMTLRWGNKVQYGSGMAEENTGNTMVAVGRQCCGSNHYILQAIPSPLPTPLALL